MTTKESSLTSLRENSEVEVFHVVGLNAPWRPLFRIAGVAALAMAALIPIQIVIFFIWPPPATVIEWFTLFNNNWLIGLIDMDLLLIIDYVLLSLVFLALYVVLRRSSQSFMTIALAFQLVAITTYFASGAAFEMLSLSRQYFGATSAQEKFICLAAGKETLVRWQGTAFNVSYLLGASALLIVSIVICEVISSARQRATPDF